MWVESQAALQVLLGRCGVALLEFRNGQQKLTVGIVGASCSQLARNGHCLIRQISFDQSKGQDVLIVWVIGLNGIQPACRRDGPRAVTCCQVRQGEVWLDFWTIEPSDSAAEMVI